MDIFIDTLYQQTRYLIQKFLTPAQCDQMKWGIFELICIIIQTILSISLIEIICSYSCEHGCEFDRSSVDFACMKHSESEPESGENLFFAHWMWFFL